MGLRYRKSIKIAPGLKVNFGTTGMSLSMGVPGLHRTYHTSGKVTTSVGIPGTGLYYVDVQGPNQRRQRAATPNSSGNQEYIPPHYEEVQYTNVTVPKAQDLNTRQLSINDINSIHKKSDDSVDWTELLVNNTPPDDSYNIETWNMYHRVAGQILSGNIDAYLDLIYSVNPLNDLTEYAGSFEFGTDNPQSMAVVFEVNDSALEDLRNTNQKSEYNQIFLDYVCSVCIRIARDIFALLPVKKVLINAQYNDKTIVSVIFDKEHMSKIRYGFIDSSETLAQFEHNMNFDSINGFSEIKELKL